MSPGKPHGDTTRHRRHPVIFTAHFLRASAENHRVAISFIQTYVSISRLKDTSGDAMEVVAGTKERIVAAAEKLFADKGFAETSLRGITSEAGVNLAAVHYHFGSKDALVQAVFRRMLAPINRERRELLDALEARAPAGVPPALEDVLRAFLFPPLRLWKDPERGVLMMKLLGRLYSEPETAVPVLFKREFKPLMERFVPALRRALPELDHTSTMWCLHFLVGAMKHTVGNYELMRRYGDSEIPLDPPEEIMERLVQFAAGGFRAALEGRPPAGLGEGTGVESRTSATAGPSESDK